MTLRDTGLASMAHYYFNFRDTDKQNQRNLLLPSFPNSLLALIFVALCSTAYM